MENEILDSQLKDVNEDVRWAGFWIRVGASLIDFLIYLPIIGSNLYNIYVLKSLPLQLGIIAIMMAYKPYMEYRYGATIGKMAVKIKVVNSNFEQLSIQQSIKRYTPWLLTQVLSLYTTIVLFNTPQFIEAEGWLEVGAIQNDLSTQFLNVIFSLFALISCIIVAFDDKKQGLHDKIANTYCIYKEEN